MTSDQAPAVNPFRGLDPLAEGDAIYGRDRDFLLMRERLYSCNTTLLFAASAYIGGKITVEHRRESAAQRDTPDLLGVLPRDYGLVGTARDHGEVHHPGERGGVDSLHEPVGKGMGNGVRLPRPL